MKTKHIPVIASLLLATAFCTAAKETQAPKAGSPEFERLKSLVGTWSGKADMGQGPVDMSVTYRLISGGSVLEERVFAGTPHEMTTMYYDKGGKLAATHYCIFGNRPQFLLKAADENSLSFGFDKTCGINVKKESHMHSLKITFNDADTITTSCQALLEGKEAPECPCVLKRVK